MEAGHIRGANCPFNFNLGSEGQGLIGAILFIFLIAVSLSFMMLGMKIELAFVFIMAAIIFFVAFINTDIALSVLILSMLLSPEFAVGGVPGRAVGIRLDDIFLIVIFMGWLAKMAVNKELGLLRNSPLNIPVIIYIGVYLVATLLGTLSGKLSVLKSFFYLLKYVEYFMLYFMVTNCVRTEKQVRVFVKVILLTCFIVCIYANATLGYYGRATAPFEHVTEANTLGGYLVLIFALVAGFFLYNTSPQRGIILGALACFIFITLLNTLSRGSFIAFIFMYLVLFVFTGRKKGFLLSVSLAALLLFSVASLGKGGSSAREGFDTIQTYRSYTSRFTVSQLFDLLRVYEKVIKRVKSTFIAGHVYSSYGSPVPLDDSTVARIVGLNRVYNMWLKQPFLGYGATGVGFTDMQGALVLGEAGVIGLVVFLWIMWSIFINTLRILKKANEDWASGLALGFLAGFIGLLFHSFGANTFIIIRIMEPFWFLAAMVMALPGINAGEARNPE